MLCLEAGFPGDRLSRRQLRRHLVSARADLGVLGRRGHPLQGYVLVLSHRQRRDVRLYSIVVDPALRGQGAGRALLDWALRRSRQRGAAGLRLEVRVDNPAARALYAARGFREIGGRTGYYEDGADAVCLRRPFV